jgi:hypothetical protein
MRIAEAFCKMRLSEYCSAQDIDRAIAVTVDSFIGSQKVSCKKALSRAFAKYVPSVMLLSQLQIKTCTNIDSQIHALPAQAPIQPEGWRRCPRSIQAPAVDESAVKPKSLGFFGDEICYLPNVTTVRVLLFPVQIIRIICMAVFGWIPWACGVKGILSVEISRFQR